jgi:2-polyprenyl-3-methyl-5-hydroxy-6-metoxy-1,4-benzoquinol methylase
VNDHAGTHLAREGRQPTCRFCGARLDETFVDLGMSPLCEKYVAPDRLNEAEPFYPLHVWICRQCLLVQLEAVVTPEELFSDYAYFSSYSDSWVLHARAYCEEVVRRFGLDGNSRIVEIASNDGYLLQHFAARGLNVLGIEPAVNVARVAKARGIPTEVRYFGRDTAADVRDRHGRADLLIGNNVLPHVPDLNDFVSGMKRLLALDGVITMEFPHLMQLVEQSQFDTIYHEHFSYFSFFTAERVFQAHDLTVFDAEQLGTHGGSLRIYAQHTESGRHRVTDRTIGLRDRERAGGYDRLEAYSGFGDKVEAIRRSLVDFLIRSKTEGKRVAGYGAPGKGNTLLNYCGIGPGLLEYTVDRSPYKQGLYTPGTRIPIGNPSRIAEARPDYLLILPWNLKEEIMEQMAYIREWGGRFVVPIPTLRVFD